MHNVHTRNTVRYYILIVAVLAFLFFSNDFGLTDVQKRLSSCPSALIEKRTNLF